MNLSRPLVMGVAIGLAGASGCATDGEEPAPPPPDDAFIAPTPATDRSCDVVLQDCAEGTKCSALSSTAALPVWWTKSTALAPVEAPVCAPLVGERQLDEECTSDPVVGTDDCDAGLYCFATDAARTRGRCAALCNPAIRDCAHVGLPNRHCYGAGVAAPGLCFATCVPLAQPCAVEGHDCGWWYDYPFVESFACLPAGELGEGDACGPARCSAGLDCWKHVCRAYCAADDAAQCPSGYCSRIRPEEELQWLGVCWIEDPEAP